MSRAWRNTDGGQRCRPVELVEARSREAVVAAVERAAAAERTIRVAGSGRSCNDIVPTDGTLLTIDVLDGVLDVDRESGLARVEAGITLRALDRELDAQGLAIPNLGSIDLQTLAGAIATDTHGSGLYMPNLAGQVEAVEIVTGTGEVVELDASDEEALRAARVGLGALGAVTAITLRCVPAYTIEETESSMPLDEVLGSLDELLERNDHFELWAFPYTDGALVTMRNRTDRPPSPPGAAREWVEQVLVRNRILSAACSVARRVPGLAPRIARAMVRGAQPGTRVDRSHRIFTGPRLVPVVESEWSLPLDAAATAIRETLRLLEEARYPVPLPVGCRFGGPTEASLSLSAERPSAYVDVLVFRGLDWATYVEPIEALMDGLGGRPHWGKLFRASADSLARLYPAWDSFQAVRARLDPAGRFSNGYVDRVLGPVRAPERA